MVGAAAVAHRSAQPAHQLMDHGGSAPLYGTRPSMPFGHELLGGALAFGVLEIAVGAALLHRAERAHAAVALVRAALVELDLAGRFLGAGEEAAEHHRTTRPAASALAMSPE